MSRADEAVRDEVEARIAAASAEELREWAYSWLYAYAIKEWRSANRVIERQAQAQLALLRTQEPTADRDHEADDLDFLTPQQHVAAMQVLDQRQDALVSVLAGIRSTRFAVANGRWVSWGDATIEDHQRRIRFMERKAEGIERDLALHRQAADLLKATGAGCLNALLNEEATA